jgi:aminopeptidase N
VFGYADAVKYINGYKTKVQNRQPIITERGLHRSPPQDMYFKGALFLHTLRSVVNDDARWRRLLRAFYDNFKYQNIMTEDVVEFFSRTVEKDLTPIFDQYLRHAELPTLELSFREADGSVAYRWLATVKDFAMPVKVGRPGQWQIIEPSTEWKTMSTPLKRDEFEVAMDLYYVNVTKQ